MLLRGGMLLTCALLTVGCATVECEVAPPREGSPPPSLEATGFLCGDAVAYEPAYPLWSDGMGKQRFIRLPEDAQIDTSDMDHWEFPVGTRLWKEIADEDHVVETRLAERWGPGEDDWNYRSYTSDPSYEPPNCQRCHSGAEERVLGFSAIQLSRDAGRGVAAEMADRFTHAPRLDTPLADDHVSRRALGTLHANCGGCHNDGPNAVGSSLDLRLRVTDRVLEDTAAFRTTVGVPTDTFADMQTRVVPGDPSASALFFRMAARGSAAQMPPLGTDVIDHGGAINVGTWINDLANREGLRP